MHPTFLMITTAGVISWTLDPAVYRASAAAIKFWINDLAPAGTVGTISGNNPSYTYAASGAHKEFGNAHSGTAF